MNQISKDEIERLYNKLKREAESAGYNLNPDEKFTKDLIEGLIVNEKKFPDSFINQVGPLAPIAIGLALRRVDDK